MIFFMRFVFVMGVGGYSDHELFCHSAITNKQYERDNVQSKLHCCDVKNQLLHGNITNIKCRFCSILIIVFKKKK